ncbi:hypothetical protein RD110_15595 [Rhodoferax koreense]|uniref:N4-gp56 family major capsid protein n=1 Tax=Rhodoferax koreensis TaxID=1842727 RepID=A0A1P8JXG7_9BURK|nr:DUF4043 family protein [Rhodoferax koreense]APW38446.1 hypothetical protein RD110_15595 [Rhodoferax koreense]
MSNTSVPSGNPLANKQYSKALSAMAVRQPTPLAALTGPMPSEKDAMDKLAKQQTTTDMPVVRVDELAKGPGDTVQLDCAHVVKLRAVMGDQNAEGKGAALKYSTQDIKIDMATLPVSGGGKMTQQRTPHSMRQNALAQLKSGMPRFRWQRCLTHLAGARGNQDSTDWILPLTSDPEFVEQMVNTVRAPTFNRHFVVNAGGLTQGGAQLASLATTDLLKLSCIDELAAIWGEMAVKMAPIQIPGDPAAGDDPIKGILLMDELAWDAMITDTTSSNNIRTFEVNAMKRAEYGDLKRHPLFSGSPILWNGILMRKMQFGIRFNASEQTNIVTQANRLTATESAVTIAAGLSTTHQVSRSLFLGAQALGIASGANRTSEETYSLLENYTNFGRNLELAGEVMGAEQKLRWSLPNPSGDLEPTDFGVAVIDSVVKRRNVS